MSAIAIRVENLSKAYRIGLAEPRHETLLGATTSFVCKPLRNFRDLRNLARVNDAAEKQRTENREQKNGDDVIPSQLSSPRDLVWALRDVSFEVQRGEVLAIIGRNGAGKSTLLKILSRITEPTSGRALMCGRVASLLEVGTGFHPDLTGRENIYLNGTILGMKKREIDARFDEIAAFAGSEQFLDTPVKRYSSGMRVRLAFAVAAHLDPEILIIDEVLAVGDAAFQKKCLTKLRDVAGHGRTVLFVSHNMVAVTTLCRRALLLNHGGIEDDGPSEIAVEKYLSTQQSFGGRTWTCSTPLQNSPLWFQEASLTEIRNGRLVIECTLRRLACRGKGFLAFDISDSMGNPLFQAMPEPDPLLYGDPGMHRIQVEIDLPLLIPGRYSVDLWAGGHFTETYHHVRHALGFHIVESPVKGRTFPHSKDHGSLVARARVRTADEVAPCSGV